MTGNHQKDAGNLLLFFSLLLGGVDRGRGRGFPVIIYFVGFHNSRGAKMKRMIVITWSAELAASINSSTHSIHRVEGCKGCSSQRYWKLGNET